MKKIALITIFDNTNFGTYLQTLALGKILKDNNCEVEVVNYIRPSQTEKGIVKKYLNNGLIKTVYNLLCNFIPMLLLRHKDHKFVKQYLCLSKKYTSLEALKNNPPEADVYMTGSDQVWNSWYNKGIDKVYYLDFAPIGKPRVAYGASIGMVDFPENEKVETKVLLEKYQYISVREQQAKQILENIGIQNIEVVLDPTLLLSKTDWLNLIDTSVFKKTEPYLLVYSVEGKNENGLIKQIAEKIAKERNLAIYSVSYSGRRRNGLNFADKCFTRTTPPIFLSLFAQADFTVVSSFHGTAFSINLNKDFITVTPGKFNSRIDNLLNMCKLQEREISDENSYSDILLKPIDYLKVNEILAKERKKSIEFIRDIINFTSTELKNQEV